MGRLFAAAAILVLLHTSAPAQQLPRSPALRTPERRAILDAADNHWFTGWWDDSRERVLDFYAESFQTAEGQVMWRRHSETVFVPPWHPLDGRRGGVFVKWRKEGGRWVVDELGILNPNRALSSMMAGLSGDRDPGC